MGRPCSRTRLQVDLADWMQLAVNLLSTSLEGLLLDWWLAVSLARRQSLMHPTVPSYSDTSAIDRFSSNIILLYPSRSHVRSRPAAGTALRPTTIPSLLESPILEYPDEITIRVRPCSSALSSSPTDVANILAVLRRWVVGWAWLQPDRRIWVQVRHNALQSRWNTVVAVQGACALASSASSRLRVQVGLLLLLRVSVH